MVFGALVILKPSPFAVKRSQVFPCPCASCSQWGLRCSQIIIRIMRHSQSKSASVDETHGRAWSVAAYWNLRLPIDLYDSCVQCIYKSEALTSRHSCLPTFTMSQQKFPTRRLGADGPFVSALGYGAGEAYIDHRTEAACSLVMQVLALTLKAKKSSKRLHVLLISVSHSGIPQMYMGPVSYIWFQFASITMD